MYRVLGVFSDTNGDNHVKLIKYKSLGKYSWTSDYSVDDSWINSDLYHRLNGLCGNDSCKDKDGNVINNIFVGNNDYIIENNEWDSLIKPWKYSIVNTNSNANKAVNYFNGMSMKEIYLHELNRNAGTIKGGTFQSLQFKIGLMYASDYSLSLGNSSLQMTGGSYTNRELLKNSWINLNNNDSNNLSEWLLTEYGMDEEISNIGGPPYCNAWFIQGTTGAIGGYHTVANLKQRFNGNVISWMDVRPVFYLNSEVSITKGIGTINNPYIVKVPSIS